MITKIAEGPAQAALSKQRIVSSLSKRRTHHGEE